MAPCSKVRRVVGASANDLKDGDSGVEGRGVRQRKAEGVEAILFTITPIFDDYRSPPSNYR